MLADPHQRAIYDCLGEAGLEEPGWQLVQVVSLFCEVFTCLLWSVQRTKTPREIREEFEALARAREERRLQQRTNPTSRLGNTCSTFVSEPTVSHSGLSVPRCSGRARSERYRPV